ncbi:MAG: hypothetical protein ACOYB3_03970 [Azonexus sp.]
MLNTTKRFRGLGRRLQTRLSGQQAGREPNGKTVAILADIQQVTVGGELRRQGFCVSKKITDLDGAIWQPRKDVIKAAVPN